MQFVAPVNSRIIGKNYPVLLLKNFKSLSEVVVVSGGLISYGQMCYNIKSSQSSSLISANETCTNQFKIFPNPAKAGSDIKIEWRKAEQGEYAIDLYNLQG